MKDHHNGTEGSYLKAVASAAKSFRHVQHAEDSFVALFKFHRMRGRVAVPRAIKLSSYFDVYNCAPHWAYMAVNGNNRYNEVIPAPPSNSL